MYSDLTRNDTKKISRWFVWCGHQIRYSGMLPCFFGGLVSRLFSRSDNARISFGRRLGRLNYLVDEASLSGHVRIGKLLFQFKNARAARRFFVLASLISRR